MNGPIRRVGYAVSVLILVLVGQLTYLQVIDADRLANDTRNVRTLLRDYNRPRGEIVTADGELVARSVPSDGEFEYQREYPLGALFAQVSGYQSFCLGNTGVEATYDRILTGRDTGLSLSNLGDFVSGRTATPRVVLTVSKAAQQIAADALGGQRGSVVAIDVKTGGIAVLFSNPSYDPSPLAGHDTTAVQAAFDGLKNDPANPALARAYRERYPPGSTFKVLTTAAALEAGVATVDRVFPRLDKLTLPQSTNTLANFGNQVCGGSLLESFVASCNTTFGQLGLDLGERFVPAMDACGIPAAPPIDLTPGAAESVGPPAGSFQQNQPQFALAGIGQGDVAVTPLEMALLTAAVANDGVMMEPHVVGSIQNDSGRTLRTVEAKRWKSCMAPTTARTLSSLMTAVVERGTGTAAQIPGVSVAGKTGTAQTGAGSPHAWFVGFAPVEAPRFAVAVIVENGGSFGSEATGGAVAAPIAADVLRSLLGV